jgi:hypothetical protein
VEEEKEGGRWRMTHVEEDEGDRWMMTHVEEEWRGIGG